MPYRINLDYSHSVLAFHKFDVCPHLPVEISMITVSETELINKSHQDQLSLTDKASRKKLKEIFDKMSTKKSFSVDEPITEGSFMLSSHSELDFEVLYSRDIKVNQKMGLYMEIFYSPYDDEVLELFLKERYGSMQL